jgi:hypothetical protein
MEAGWYDQLGGEGTLADAIMDRIAYDSYKINIQHLIQHLPVLRSHADNYLKSFSFLHFQHKGHIFIASGRVPNTVMIRFFIVVSPLYILIFYPFYPFSLFLP